MVRRVGGRSALSGEEASWMPPMRRAALGVERLLMTSTDAEVWTTLTSVTTVP